MIHGKLAGSTTDDGLPVEIDIRDGDVRIVCGDEEWTADASEVSVQALDPSTFRISFAGDEYVFHPADPLHARFALVRDIARAAATKRARFRRRPRDATVPATEPIDPVGRVVLIDGGIEIRSITPEVSDPMFPPTPPAPTPSVGTARPSKGPAPDEPAVGATAPTIPGSTQPGLTRIRMTPSDAQSTSASSPAEAPALARSQDEPIEQSVPAVRDECTTNPAEATQAAGGPRQDLRRTESTQTPGGRTLGDRARRRRTVADPARVRSGPDPIQRTAATAAAFARAGGTALAEAAAVAGPAVANATRRSIQAVGAAWSLVTAVIVAVSLRTSRALTNAFEVIGLGLTTTARDVAQRLEQAARHVRASTITVLTAAKDTSASAADWLTLCAAALGRALHRGWRATERGLSRGWRQARVISTQIGALARQRGIDRTRAPGACETDHEWAATSHGAFGVQRCTRCRTVRLSDEDGPNQSSAGSVTRMHSTRRSFLLDAAAIAALEQVNGFDEAD